MEGGGWRGLTEKQGVEKAKSKGKSLNAKYAMGAQGTQRKAKAKALTQRARWMRGGQKHPTLHPIEQRMLAGDPGLPDDETVGRGWGTLRPEMPPLLLVMRPTEECVH